MKWWKRECSLMSDEERMVTNGEAVTACLVAVTGGLLVMIVGGLPL